MDRDTGRQLWTFDSGPPLLSVSGTADDKQDSEDSSARSPVHSVIPSVHGKLYGYRQQGPFTRGLEVPLSSSKLLHLLLCLCSTPCKALLQFLQGNQLFHIPCRNALRESSQDTMLRCVLFCKYRLCLPSSQDASVVVHVGVTDN